MRYLLEDFKFLWRKNNRLAFIFYFFARLILFSAPILKNAILMYWLILSTSTFLISLRFRYMTTDYNIVKNNYLKLGHARDNIIDFILSKNILSLFLHLPILYIFFKICVIFNIESIDMNFFFISLKYTILSLALENILLIFNNKVLPSYTEEYFRRDMAKDVEIGFITFIYAIPTFLVTVCLTFLYYFKKFNPSYILVIFLFIFCLSMVYFLRNKIYSDWKIN